MLMQSFKWLRNPKVFLRVKGFYKVFLGAISQRHTKYDIQHFERPNSNVCFRLTGWWGEKYSHKGGQKKKFSPFFDVVALFILYFYPDSIHYVYLKWLIYIETSSCYILNCVTTWIQHRQRSLTKHQGLIET